MSATAALVWGGLIGVISSLVAAVIFSIFGIFINVPKIEISPIIARTRSNNKNHYKIKIINKRRRAAVDVNVNVFSDRSNRDGNHTLRRIEFEGPVEPGFTLTGFIRNDRQARYARRFAIKEDEISDLEPGRAIVVRVLCRDSLTGAAKQFEQSYSAESVRDGMFMAGKSFDVWGANI